MFTAAKMAVLTAATGTSISTKSPARECLMSLSFTSKKYWAHSYKHISVHRERFLFIIVYTVCQLKYLWNCFVVYLQKLERRFKIFHWVHFNTKELDPHNEADGALDHIRALLFLPELLQLWDELLPHCRKPGRNGMVLIFIKNNTGK